MNLFDHVRKTFTLEHLPANIRASRSMGRWPFIRRYKDLPVGLKLLPAMGKFSYQGSAGHRLIQFNARNLQFHALYEKHYRHGYELETALLIAHLCQGSRPFFDIGSNWGYFSLLAASLPEFNGAIYAFEPNPRTFVDLTDIIRQAAVQNRVTPCHLGVGRTACDLVVAETDRYNSGLSRLAPEGAGQKVSVKPLDALEFGSPNVVKIDAEGMELDILAGATQMLKVAKPFVIFENFLDFSAPRKTYEIIQFLGENDYQVFLPVLEFAPNSSKIMATYGHDYTLLVEQHGPPRIGALRLSSRLRFLLPGQLNLLAVHTERAPELWKTGVVDFGAI